MQPDEEIKWVTELSKYKHGDDYSVYDGYRVDTNLGSYYCLIDNREQCCEQTGYFMSEDNLMDFVGAKLIKVNITDKNLNKKELPSLDEGGCVFVDFETDRGVLQFCAYNSHNGYYGHDALVFKEGVMFEGTL